MLVNTRFVRRRMVRVVAGWRQRRGSRDVTGRPGIILALYTSGERMA